MSAKRQPLEQAKWSSSCIEKPVWGGSESLHWNAEVAIIANHDAF